MTRVCANTRFVWHGSQKVYVSKWANRLKCISHKCQNVNDERKNDLSVFLALNITRKFNHSRFVWWLKIFHEVAANSQWRYLIPLCASMDFDFHGVIDLLSIIFSVTLSPPHFLCTFILFIQSSIMRTQDTVSVVGIPEICCVVEWILKIPVVSSYNHIFMYWGALRVKKNKSTQFAKKENGWLEKRSVKKWYLMAAEKCKNTREWEWAKKKWAEKNASLEKHETCVYYFAIDICDINLKVHNLSLMFFYRWFCRSVDSMLLIESTRWKDRQRWAEDKYKNRMKNNNSK